MTRRSMAGVWIVALASVAASAGAAHKAQVKLPTTMPRSPGYHVVKYSAIVGDKPVPMATCVFLPPPYFTSKERFPVVVTLANRGAEGTDGKGMLNGEGLALMMSSDNPDTRGSGAKPRDAVNVRKAGRFIGLSPQCPPGWGWESPGMADVLDQLVSELAKVYRADEDRVTLTGFSYGGSSTWTVALAIPHRFAAIVPLSFRVPGDPQAAQKLKHVGIWIAGGDQEWATPEVQRMHQVLAAAKHPNFRYQMVQGGNHWCYACVYSDAQFWKWLEAQRRPKR